MKIVTVKCKCGKTAITTPDYVKWTNIRCWSCPPEKPILRAVK